MSLENLEYPLSKLVNSDTFPRPTTIFFLQHITIYSAGGSTAFSTFHNLPAFDLPCLSRKSGTACPASFAILISAGVHSCRTPCRISQRVGRSWNGRTRSEAC